MRWELYSREGDRMGAAQKGLGGIRAGMGLYRREGMGDGR